MEQSRSSSELRSRFHIFFSQSCPAQTTKYPAETTEVILVPTSVLPLQPQAAPWGQVGMGVEKIETKIKPRRGRVTLREIKERVEALLEQRAYAQVEEEIEAFSRVYTPKERDVDWAELQVRLAFAEEQLGRYDTETAKTAYELLKFTDRHAEIGAIEWVLGRMHLGLGKVRVALRYLRNSFSQFDRIEDGRRKAQVLNTLGRACFLSGRMKEAIEHLTGALDLCHQGKGNMHQEAMLRGNLGACRIFTGEWSLASDMLRGSLKLYEETGDRLEIARRSIALARLLIMQRNFSEAEELLQRAEALSQTYPREKAMAYESLGDLAKEKGQFQKAKQYYQKTLDIGRKLASQGDIINQVQRRRAELLLMEGQNLQASKCCEEALCVSQYLGDKYEEGCCYRVQALISEAQGNLKETKESFEKAIRILSSIKEKFELGRTLLEQGRFYAFALKDRYRGLNLLQEADRLFSEIGPGCRYYQGLAKLQMARVEMAFSRPNEAQSFVAQAETIFGELGEKDALKDTEELRSQVEGRFGKATDSEENPYLLLKELSLEPPSEAGLRERLKSLLHTLAQRVGADQGFVAYRETDGLKVAERVKLREEEAEKALHLLAANSLEPGKLMVKLSAEGKFSPLKVGALLVMPLGLKGRLDGILCLAQKPGRIGWRQEDVHFFVAASEHIHRVVADLRVEGLEAENLVLRAYQIADSYGFPRLITDDEKMKEVLRIADKVKNAREPVLLTGESGTGKELIAKLIHYSSQRKEMPFMAINCGAIPENLLESELFGHERGAFTDARSQRKGLFEIANGGTVFLDEVGDMNLALQPKLLRFLETKSFRRVGGTREIKVVVRVIAATNKDLQARVKAGKFSDALFYRLNCFTMELPSLGQRREDIPLLVNYFLERLNQANHTRRTITPEAMEMFMEREYPGNVRELENLIKKAVILADGDMITPDLVQESERAAGRSEEKGLLKEKVGNFERGLIKKALAKHGGNRTKTAEFLGLSRRGLLKKMVKYSIKGETSMNKCSQKCQ